MGNIKSFLRAKFGSWPTAGALHAGMMRLMGLFGLVPHLARKMLPTRRMLFFACTRLAIGLITIRLAGLLPWETARGWLEFGGRMFVVLAIMNLLAHPEGIFMDALARNTERLTGFRIGS